MKSWLRAAAVSLLLPITIAATAGTERLQWQCWYDLGSHIRCMIDAASSAAAFEAEAAPAELPHLIQAIWADGLRKSTIRYTLDRQHPDRDSMAAFAKASVCGAYRDCTVIFSPQPPTVKQYLAMVERNDPSAATQLAQALHDRHHRPAATELALALPD